MRVTLTALLVAPALVMVGTGAALACSCADVSTAEYVGYADTVAVGELTATDPVPRADSNEPITYTASLETVLKGEPDNPLVFRSAAHGASCGLEGMVLGRDYVFFVADDEATLCDGTTQASPALIAKVEAVTGPGHAVSAPNQEASGTSTAQGTTTAVTWALGIAGVLMLLVGAVLIWGRRARG